MPRNSSAKVINYNNPSSVTRGEMQKNRTRNGSSSSAITKTMSKDTALKAKEALQSFVNNYRDVAQFEQARSEALRAIADITDIYERPDTIPAMSEGLKKTNQNANTLIGAIRDNIFNAKGFNSMLADQRRGQVMQVLNGQNLTMPTTTTNTPATTGETSAEETSAEDVVEYTYKPGDTFGQVIKNLGLQTNHGLWGPDGDVAYYTQQLAEQGAMNSRGNIPIGTTIRLVRRK